MKEPNWQDLADYFSEDIAILKPIDDGCVIYLKNDHEELMCKRALKLITALKRKEEMLEWQHRF